MSEDDQLDQSSDQDGSLNNEDSNSGLDQPAGKIQMLQYF
jgi:hypothetical protein